MTAAQTLTVIAAFAAANLPFLTERLFLGIPGRKHEKPLHLRLLELVLLYLVLGFASRALEGMAYGDAYAQNWEFYAITFCLFLVFAYPGFVYRYLWQRSH